MRSLLARLLSNRIMALFNPASQGSRAPLSSIGRAAASPRQHLWFSSVLGQQHRCVDCVTYRPLMVAPFLQHRREMLSAAVQVRGPAEHDRMALICIFMHAYVLTIQPPNPRGALQVAPTWSPRVATTRPRAVCQSSEEALAATEPTSESVESPPQALHEREDLPHNNGSREEKEVLEVQATNGTGSSMSSSWYVAWEISLPTVTVTKYYHLPSFLSTCALAANLT